MSNTDTPPADVEAVTRVIERRRSIKPSDFSDDPVDDEIVWKMLRSANFAPTHGLTEPWRFFVFTGDARYELGKRLAEIYREITPPEAFKSVKAEKLVSNAARSSHLIVIGMKRQESEKIPEIEEVEAVACAVQNLHLTATVFGIAGYWSSGKAICSNQLRDYINLTEKDRILGLFYVGCPGIDWPDGVRTPIEDKVTWRSTSE